MLYFCMCTYMLENISHKIYWVTRIYFIGNLRVVSECCTFVCVHICQRIFLINILGD